VRSAHAAEAPAAWEADVAQPVSPGAACDRAVGLPREIQVVSPDHTILEGVTENRNTALEEAVAACTAAVAAAPAESSSLYRLGLSLAALERRPEALAAFTRAKDLGFSGGYDAIAEGRFEGLYGEDLPKDLAAGFAVIREGIERTGHPELKRGLAMALARAEPPHRDSAQALVLLDQAARAGHGPAAADLAQLLAEGADGSLEPDTPRIRSLLDAAVAAGSRRAMFVYAHLLDKGPALPQDLVTARALYMRAAEAGSISGMLEAAGMMRAGEGGPVDVESQRRWLVRASGLGSRPARLALATSHIDMEPTNTRLGLVLLERLAEDGYSEAAHELGVRYQDAVRVQRDYLLALKWFRRAAEAGDGRAMKQIGKLHDYGEGVAVDHAEARRWYDRAAAKGVASAYTAIGMQYDHAMGVTRDLAEALVWYRRGAERGSAASMNNLGFAYQTGRGVRRDDAEAARWLQKAVDQNDRTAKLNLANLHFAGRGVPQDQVRGLVLLQQSAEQGLPQALNDLALLEMERSRGSGERAVRMLREAAVGRAPVAYHNLGMALIQGWDGTPDYQEANYWFRQSVDNRSDIDPGAYSESQFQLGRNLVRGIGITRDRDEGLRLIRAAASARNPRAQAYLVRYEPGRVSKVRPAGSELKAVRIARPDRGARLPAKPDARGRR
jgi:TPR repeat protein